MSVTPKPFATLYPARTGPRPMTAEDLWNLPRVGGASVAPCGTWAVVPVTRYDLEKNEGRTRLYKVALDGKSEPVAITSPDVSASEPRVSPDGTQLAFTRKDANGKPQLMLMPLAGGEARKLTDLPLGVFDPRWMPDGSGLIVASMLVKGHFTPEATAAEIKRRAEDPVKAHVTEDRVYRYWDTWLTTGEVPHLWHVKVMGAGASGSGAAAGSAAEVRDVTPTAAVWFDWMDPSGQYDISPDGTEIALAGLAFDEKRSLLLTQVWTVPVAGGDLSCLTTASKGENLRPRYTRDGAAIVYGFTEDPLFYADRVRLAKYDRASGKTTTWLGDWDLTPTSWDFLDDGRLAFAAEEDARVKVFTYDGAGAPKAVTGDGCAAGLAVARGARVVYTHQSLSSMAELYVTSAAGGTPTRLTRFTDEVHARFALGEVREMTFAGSKGETVQMFVVLPVGFDPKKKYPLVHVIHGGPHGISADQFHARWNAQMFASPGYVVGVVNFQGSTSWGQDYAKRIQGAWAERPFEDIMKATDALVATGFVDEQRMAVTGGSYGGYMVSWIGGHTDRFRCIVNHAGVCDLTGQYASDVTQGRGEAAGGEAWDGLEKQDLWSPIRFASGMNTPMLVVHGERDYRVPVGQGLLIYGVLKAKGVPARLVYFPDENHWVLKPRNSLLWNREVHAWLARWLKD